jgi:uncharacterized protein (DUF2147 family)
MRALHLALFLAYFLVLNASGAMAQAGLPTAAGLWEQIDDKTGKSDGWFLIYEKKDAEGIYDGAIARMFIPPGENQHPICTKCQGDQKNRPSLGLTIIKNMHRNGLKYENGTILDPRDGNVYNALMELSPDGQTLTVRGYLGIELFGRNQIWHRLPDSALAQVDPSIIAAHAPALLPLAGYPPMPSPAPPRPPLIRGQVR